MNSLEIEYLSTDNACSKLAPNIEVSVTVLTNCAYRSG